MLSEYNEQTVFPACVQNIYDSSIVEQLSRLMEIQRQVAHDIRSPLAALNVFVNNLLDISPENKKLLNSALNRINEIADDLRYHINRNAFKKKEISFEELSGLIEEIISEKKIEYREYDDIKISCHVSETSENPTVQINESEFKRVLSNIINNAVEGMNNNGLVTVRVVRDDPYIKITISDNGKGIPKELLPTIMQKGTTYGKTHGSGLGLYHAKNCIESWGGSLEIHSLVEHGTTLTIILSV